MCRTAERNRHQLPGNTASTERFAIFILISPLTLFSWNQGEIKTMKWSSDLYPTWSHKNDLIGPFNSLGCTLPICVVGFSVNLKMKYLLCHSWQFSGGCVLIGMSAAEKGHCCICLCCWHRCSKCNSFTFSSWNHDRFILVGQWEASITFTASLLFSWIHQRVFLSPPLLTPGHFPA